MTTEHPITHTERPRVTAGVAQADCAKLLIALGVSVDNARTTARQLVAADLRGTDTHGLAQLPIYLERLSNGYIRAAAEPEIVNGGSVTTVITGNNGLGQVTSEYAMNVAIEKALSVGTGVSVVHKSHHFGAAAGYALLAADVGCLGIVTTNTPAFLAPAAGFAPRIGNNPLAIASPGDQFPIVLDTALSVSSVGSIKRFAAEGTPIPDGWAFDEHGRNTTDARLALGSGTSLAAIGGHKGIGLAMMMSILTGVLSGGVFEDQVNRLNEQDYLNSSHFFLAIDVRQFMELDLFRSRVALFCKYVHDSPSIADTGDVSPRLPGERQAVTMRERTRYGIPYAHYIRNGLVKCAQDLNVQIDPRWGSAN